MASNSGWDKTIPSGTSLINQGDNEIRSMKSSLQAWWEEEHFATDGSANSAGEHKQGSARAYSGTLSQLSNPEIGRLFFATDEGSGGILKVASNSSWSNVGGVATDAENTFTEMQTFNSGISASNISISDAGIKAFASGFTVLASTITLAAGTESDIQLVNTDSSVTAGDPVSIGYHDDNWTVGSRTLAQGNVLSTRSIGIQFSNPTGNQRTIDSGQTIRYVVYRMTS